MDIPANSVLSLINKISINTIKSAIIPDLDRSLDCWLVDATTGRKYLDCTGFYGTLPISYNHPIYKEAQNSLVNCVAYKTDNESTTSAEYASLLKTFTDLLTLNNLKYTVFCSPNTEIQQILQLASKWKITKLNIPQSCLKLFKPIFLNDIFFNINEKDIETYEKEAIKQIIDNLNNNLINSIIIEPIRIQNNFHMPRQSFFDQLRDICDKHNCLLVANEFLTGFGISGKWWSCEKLNIQPDIIMFGCKSQVSGFIINENLKNIQASLKNTSSNYITNYALSDLYIRIIQKDQLLENADKVGNYLLVKLRSIESISAIVSNTRGLGLMIAFDVPNNNIKEDIIKKLLNKNILVHSYGDKTIGISPSLTFSKENVDYFLDSLKKALS